LTERGGLGITRSTVGQDGHDIAPTFYKTKDFYGSLLFWYNTGVNQPTLIVIGGFAGAGKTTVVAELSKKYNYPVFSSDVLNDALRPALHISSKEVSPIAYQVLWHLVRKQLSAGTTVIVDAHMAAAHIWDSLDALKQEMPGVIVIPIILQATLETHRIRIEERGRTNTEHLNLGGDMLVDILFKYEYIENLKRPDLIRIDANGTLQEVYAAADALIQEKLSQ
jgi:predicted kinase